LGGKEKQEQRPRQKKVTKVNPRSRGVLDRGEAKLRYREKRSSKDTKKNFKRRAQKTSRKKRGGGGKNNKGK